MLKEIILATMVASAPLPTLSQSGFYHCDNMMTMTPNNVMIFDTGKELYVGLNGDEVHRNMSYGNRFVPVETKEVYSMWEGQGPDFTMPDLILKVYDLLPNTIFVFDKTTSELLSVCKKTNDLIE
jgi:hypothetical protein